MKLLYYILFFAIFGSRYLFVICQNVPSPRRQQTSTLVGARLYFFGGGISPTSITNEVWYLDLSSSFKISTPPWHSNVAMPVRYNLGSSCLSPIDSSTVFLIGGRTWTVTTGNYSYTSSVYKFDSKTSQWTTPTINNFNSSFEARNEMQAVIDDYGKIFVFGGNDYINPTRTPISNVYNDMNTLDITTMTWSTQAQSQSALTNYAYTATLLPNGLIVYIGGYSGSNTSTSNTNMAQIQVFDTKLYAWSTKPASGSIIASRRHQSAVLTQDGNIIIYGGSTHDSSGNIAYVFSDIAVLNTNSWVWSVPSVSGISAPPLMQHSAVLYKNYMILAFGATSASILYTNNIYILDIQNYTWVTTFNIPTTTKPAKQTQSNGNSSADQANNSSSNLYIGIGIGIGVVILAIVLFVIGFFIYKNRHKQEIIATPGTSKDDHIRETHISTIYTPGMPPPAKYELTPTYGVPLPGNNYHSS
ncbi:galactose oxidase [Gigaspora margarita]|uniref:Galactose oxidase n=1 Tax=Gigaspora margarita TaxID=4874 RepID=A0A8H4B0B2_GIGMA|nr:galactose oxidase [Gigaspora margarita]